MSRDTSTAVCRSTESSVIYANELLQCDCHSPDIARSNWLDIAGMLFETARGNTSVTL